MSDFTFKQVDKNEYETFMEGNSLNIFFKIPDGCKIEDYNIEKNNLKLCKHYVGDNNYA